MKLIVLQEELHKALSSVSRFVSPRAQLPVLANILLSADQGKLRIIATNLEMGISLDIGAKVETPGALTIPAKVIVELIGNLPPGQIKLEQKQERLNIETQSTSAHLGGILASEFPSVPALIEKKDFEISKSVLRQIAKQVVISAAVDDTRPVLTGVLLVFSEDKLKAVATDGFRLSCRDITFSQGASKKILIPARVIDELVRITPEGAENISVSMLEREKQILFGTNSFVLTGRVLEGDFPDFERIIPKKFNLKAELDKEEFTRAIRGIGVFAREASNVAKFKFLDGKLIISAESQQYGQEQVVLDIKLDGEPLEVAFNYKFVMDFLGSIEGKSVTFESESQTSPGVFRDSQDSSYTHLIMPVRLQN